MKIRSEQFEEMSRARRQESQRRLITELRQTAPAATSQYDDAALLVRIEDATAKAETYGIVGNEAATIFVKLAVLAGARFDEDPSVRRFLRAPELSPDFKMTLLADLVVEKLKQTL